MPVCTFVDSFFPHFPPPEQPLGRVHLHAALSIACFHWLHVCWGLSATTNEIKFCLHSAQIFRYHLVVPDSKVSYQFIWRASPITTTAESVSWFLRSCSTGIIRHLCSEPWLLQSSLILDHLKSSTEPLRQVDHF